MSPGGSEGTFIKAGDSETRKGSAWRKQQGSPGWAALAHWEAREKGTLGTGSGDQLGTSATAHCSPGCKSPEGFYSLGDAHLGGKESRKGMDQAAPQRERTLGPLS